MRTISREAYEGDIASRLRNWRGLHLAHGGELFEEAAAEIERLRSQPCPYVTGTVTQHCTLTPFTLADAEREAIAYYVGTGGPDAVDATLRGLLKRLSPDRPEAIAAGDTATPPEPAIPPAWLSRPYWVDPAGGHRYGFPRLYDPATDGDMTAWLIANGYPERLAMQELACTFTACTEDGGK
jgi:hypothetical protein